ncbi:hypothetical protein B0T16DRAFT_393862 [Cercophora newfieldiana]|uniref:Uncharacterized protein n=1 Tax=Cercophora newfieldiana TaxID=92897 RepID=A0AA39XWL7_9PEZI|nr:hypothetical protein B0T16DRAFT_393862 [Cercophora newfieldiana]
MVHFRAILGLATLAVALPMEVPPHEALNKRSFLNPPCTSVQNSGFFAGLEIQRLANEPLTGPYFQPFWNQCQDAIIKLNDICRGTDRFLDNPSPQTAQEAEQLMCQVFGC